MKLIEKYEFPEIPGNIIIECFLYKTTAPPPQGGFARPRQNDSPPTPGSPQSSGPIGCPRARGGHFTVMVAAARELKIGLRTNQRAGPDGFEALLVAHRAPHLKTVQLDFVMLSSSLFLSCFPHRTLYQKRESSKR